MIVTRVQKRKPKLSRLSFYLLTNQLIKHPSNKIKGDEHFD